MDDYQRYIYLSRYAKWRDDLGRRETWEETVERYCQFWAKRWKKKFPYKKIYKAILNMEVMPSMRALMTAGLALERDNIAGYNCSYLTIDHPRAFDEIMYILMCGTGVGFSVENKYVGKLPSISDELHPSDTTLAVSDSRVGWASSLRELISLLYAGKIPKWDLTKVRPHGARLKTFGGRASGPEPLDSLFRYTCELFKQAAGRRLTSLECHDLVCKVADSVIVGGVRRSALISLSDIGDGAMSRAKSGSWWNDFPHRALANVSAVYGGICDFTTFINEWRTLYESKSGERGIFNRLAATEQARNTGRRDTDFEFGTNPCGEIILRPMGLCNLTEVVIRPEDTFSSLKRKVEVAAILGSFQSTLTDFRYVRKTWQTNAEEERLLGVSLTGIFDNTRVLTPANLEALKKHAIETNKKIAKVLGINQSVAVTCVKPSGTVSQLVDSSSGIHPAYSRYYIRRVRADNKDPVTVFLKEKGFPNEPEQFHKDTTTVFSFPKKASAKAITRNHVSAMEHMKVYRKFRSLFCEHNPSTTIYYSDDEFLELGGEVWRNFNEIGGLTFLPRSDHIYAQAPYEEITEEEYKKLVAALPKIDWNEFYKYEKEDMTANQHDLACSAGLCEL